MAFPEHSPFNVANDFIIHTNQSVFLTGKAGTGKTTFLKHIQQTCRKQMVTLAPTGVAAINAGGVTIHSFFQLPLAPYAPGVHAEGVYNEQTLQSRLRYGKDKQRLLRNLDLLIIDEISMVRADVMQAIDAILKRFRYNQQPFGGLQLLLIGDLFQLSPVVRQQEWQLLQQVYEGPYFFQSPAVQELQLAQVELTKVYRQQNQQFVDLLNEVRHNNLSTENYELLHSRYKPGFGQALNDGYITLTTHNNTANEINERMLQQLNAPLKRFDAIISGDFPENAYPAETSLQLKKGAQVMFIKNDNISKRYYNGKLGTVKAFFDEFILVTGADDGMDITVNAMDWENLSYSTDKESGEVNTNVLGTFSQLPLRLAWAVTIHKSQGLTFDKVVVDAGNSFSSGQAYVALSRCRSLEGMVLLSIIPPSAIRNDQRITHYSSAANSETLPQQLQDAMRRHQQQMLLGLFNFYAVSKQVRHLENLVQRHASTLEPTPAEWIQRLFEEINDLQSTAVKFDKQLHGMFADNTGMPLSNEAVLQRIQKAATWFHAALHDKVWPALAKQIPATDDKTIAQTLSLPYSDMRNEIELRQKLLKQAAELFDVNRQAELKLAFDYKAYSDIFYGGKVQQVNEETDVDLYQLLQAWRSRQSQEHDVPAYLILSNGAMRGIGNVRPINREAFLAVKGFGTKKWHAYGEELAALVNAYCIKNSMEGSTKGATSGSKKPAKQKKQQGQTYRETMEMFQRGLTLEEIAKQRGYAVSTIEGHLAVLIERGDLEKSILLNEADERTIAARMQSNPELSNTEIRSLLSNAYSFAQVRLVRAALNQLRQDGL